MMAGLLLARAGIAVTVLEKHADFLRDFRGDTVHASTVALLDELGLGAEFRELPQSRLTGLLLPGTDSQRVPIEIFAALPAPYNYVAMVPQWDLLNLLAEAARREPTFTLRMRTEATGLVVAARLLAAPLREHRLTTADLARVQQRRQQPAVILQALQRTMHLGIRALLSGRITVRPPWGLLRLVSRAPQWMVRIPARLIAVGPRPEHAPAFARR